MREIKMDCDSAKHVGKDTAYINQRLCTALCEQECNFYHTLPEIAECLARRGGLSCMFEYDVAYIARGEYCESDEGGIVIIQLEDPLLKRQLNNVKEGWSFLEAELDDTDQLSMMNCRNGLSIDLEVMSMVKNGVRNNDVTRKCGSDHYFMNEERFLAHSIGGELQRNDMHKYILVEMTNFIRHNQPYFETPLYIQQEMNPCAILPPADGSRKAGLLLYLRQPLTDMIQFLPGASAN